MSEWVVRPLPNPTARLRLFCFPYSGGGAGVFLEWPKGLPAEVEVCAMRLPGREVRLREASFTQMEPLVESALAGIRPFLDRPFVFFGHSLGALLAYNLVYRLQDEGVPPEHLFVAGYRAPHRPSHFPYVHQADETTFVDRIRNLDGSPAAFFDHPELLEMMLPTLRADFAVWETYVQDATRVPLNCPIAAFGAREDKEANQADMAAWRDYTASTFTLRMFAGGHFFIRDRQREVLQAVARDLIPYLR
ncbi:MAG: thioesterase [Anaerolineales bacterium]|nr:thioesterase [Anaerolineales bacterium]